MQAGIRATTPACGRRRKINRRTPFNVTASRIDNSFTHSNTDALALDAAEGRCNRMEIRDWLELARIQLGGLRREEGQTMTEYGVLLALIAVVVIAALLVLGPKIATTFQKVSNNL